MELVIAIILAAGLSVYIRRLYKTDLSTGQKFLYGMMRGVVLSVVVLVIAFFNRDFTWANIEVILKIILGLSLILGVLEAFGEDY